MSNCAKDDSTTSRIIFNRGDSHTVDVTVKKKDPANKRRMIPVDLTGAAAKLSVKAKESDTSYAVQLIGTVIDPENGVVEFTFNPADTASLPPSIYFYDVRVTLPGSKVYTVLKDALKLESTITAPPGPLATIIITPLSGSVAAGQILQFSAVGKDATGNVVPLVPTWSLIAGGGSIHPTSGLFTAGGTTGVYTNTVRAVQGVVSAAASVTVTP
jgi:hypothetical protein